ncbi:MAG TPA: TldD/PmbA family protein, partial [Gemmatimonadales bacterium]|nr:TldD/PmbA family protein [Gemmatimonadales bacterium]
MIAPLLERAHRRTDQADAILKNDETTTLSFTAGRLTTASTSRSQGVNLRVVSEGRLGIAGTTAEDPDELLDAALVSARGGDPVVLGLPRPGVVPQVVTHAPRAASATLNDLGGIGALVRDRLAGAHAELNLTVERSLGSVRVANTNGVDASYDVSQVTVAVELSRQQGDRRITLRGHLSGHDLPALTAIEELVADLRTRLAWSEHESTPATGTQAVLFLPSALPVILQPLEQAVLGKAAMHGVSPIAARRGNRLFSSRLTIHDNPLAAGRPGSRPIDDEGVVSRPMPLVKAGVFDALLYDLETATRTGNPATGHGRRTTFGKPQPSCTNIVVEPGDQGWTDLLRTLGDGVVVERLRGWPTGHVIGGTFAQPAAVAWHVSGGEIAGIAPELTIAGNSYDLLNRVAAL